VALTGTDGFYGPGLGTGIKFASFHTDDELFCNPVMNNRGDIVFRATITGTGITADNDKGLWLYQNGRLAPLAREGDPVPGMPGVYFDEVSEWAPEPVICDAGKVLFYGFLQGAGITSTTEEALFWGDSQSIKLIAQQWVTELPDRPGVFLGRDLVSKSMLTVEPMAMTADGRPVVRLGVHPGGGSNDYFLANIMFTPATGEIQTLAYGGDPLPGNASINQMGNALVSDGGIPAAWLEYDDLAGWGAAIFSERSGALASIYDEDEPAPGGEKYGPLHHERVAVNGDGHVAFFAWGEDQWGYDGRIFSEGPFGYDIPFLIAETGESAPGTGNGTFGFLDEGVVLLADNDTAVFIADIWDVPSTSNQGLWTNRSGTQVDLEMRKGDPAPGFGGAEFKELARVFVNSQGQILILTSLTNGLEVLWLQSSPGGNFIPLHRYGRPGDAPAVL